MSHTPGPWTITDDEFEGEQWLWIDGTNGHTVCGFGDPETGITDQHRGDARLIVSAPTLLAERDEARAECQELQRTLDLIRVASEGLLREVAGLRALLNTSDARRKGI